MNTDIKSQILTTLRQDVGGREGLENLLFYLESGTDFFTAPSSTLFHGNIFGGLAEHSWNVYTLLKEKVARFEVKATPATVAICGLLHDINKSLFYKRGKKWVKDNGQWLEKEIWMVDDKFSAGHGEKSVFLLQNFIKLTQEEMLAIRWHMASYEPGIHFNYPSGFPFRQACKEYPLVTILGTADLEATHLLEEIYEE